MDLQDFRDAVKDLIGALSGIDTTWINAPREMTSDLTQAVCLLSITSLTTQGQDEVRTAQDLDQPTGQELTESYIENRLITLTARIESQDQTSGKTSLDYLAQVQDRLVWKSSRDALHAVGAALINFGSPVDLSAVKDDHTVSIWALDIFLSARGISEDPARFPYIEKLGFKLNNGDPLTVPE